MSRYERQEILPEVGIRGQARLTAAHVLVVGAGGLGATVLPALVGAGVGQMTLMDADRVTESNLHRQTLFTMADIGRDKVDVACRRMAALNPEVRITGLREMLDPMNVDAAIAEADLVVDAADSFAATYILSDRCRELAIPLVSASVLGRSGYVGGFCGGAPSYRAVFPDLPAQTQTCATAGVMGPAVACLGAVQAQMALSVLLKHEPSPLGQFVSVDLATYRFSGFRFDGAPEPQGPVFAFAAPGTLPEGSCVVDLRGPEEAPAPVFSTAIRLLPEAIAGWTPPPDRTIALCCRSGLRAWRAAEDLRQRGFDDIVLIAAGS